MKSGHVLIFAALFQAVPAQAQDMPRYDVADHCRKVAEFGGSYSRSVEQTCFEMEQEAYDGLKPLWAGLPDTMRQHCDRVASFGSTASYNVLSTCVEMETEASGEKTFKY